MKKHFWGLLLILSVVVLNAQAQNNKTYSQAGPGAFSISYPDSWEIVQDGNRITNQTSISVQIMEKQKNAYDFRPNINVIVSGRKRVESTSALMDISVVQLKNLTPTFRLINRNDDITLSGRKGSMIEYTMQIQGYNIRFVQYVVKKRDNTTFTITVTFDANKYDQQRTVSSSILNSFIIR